MADDLTTDLDTRIHRIGSRWLFHPTVVDAGRRAGLDDPILLYAGGRGGVLGDVDAAQVVSAFGFFPAEVVNDVWNRLRARHDPRDVAAIYTAGIAEAAREELADDDDAATVARLGRAVCDEVVPMAMALFTGWRSMRRPDDTPGDAAITIMVLRELRGDIHLQDIAAAGLHPLEAESVSRGPEGISLHGWEPPYPDAQLYADRVAAATSRTDARMQRIYDAALGANTGRFADAVGRLDARIRAQEAS